MRDAELGVIGGSGLYRLADDHAEQRSVRTPYGTVDLTLTELAGRRTAFLPRHGAGHTVPPHRIAYRANIWALASLGVRAIVSSAAVGGLHPDYGPGTLVLPDQLIDRTSGRDSTFFDADSVQHLPAADPFDPALHRIAADALAASGEGERFRDSGTVVVIQGPRFSTRAESHWHAAIGGHLVNMTLAPEVFLAGELGVGTANLAFVTDLDAGVAGAPDADDANQERVFERLAAAQPRILAAITAVASALPDDYAAPQPLDADAVTAVLRADA